VPADEIPQVDRTFGLVLPLDAYMHTNETYQSFLRANAALRDDCLRRFGVEPEGPTMNYVEDSPNFDLRNEGRYGRLNLELAQERGYGAPPEYERVPDRSGLWEPDDATWFLIVGLTEFPDRSLPTDVHGEPLPEDGCNGEAVRLLDAGETPPLGFPEGLASETYYRAENHSQVQEAMESWSECMADVGHDFATIWDPMGIDWPDPVSEAEIQMAVTDMECRIETNLVGVWYAVESAYQEIVIEEHAEELAAIADWIDTVYRNAVEVLESR
jgi:hypothetical protein